MFIILVLSLLLRVLLLYVAPHVTDQIDASVEFSTPVSSWRSLQEGVFMLQNGLRLYDGGVVYHPPLLLHFFSLIQKTGFPPKLVFQLAELVQGIQMLLIASKFLEKNTSRKRYVAMFSVMYAFSPTLFLAALACSSTAFSNLFLSSALYSVVVLDSIPLASVFLALSSYILCNNVFLLVPFIGLALNFAAHTHKSSARAIASALLPFSIMAYLLYTISNTVTGGDIAWILASYGTEIFFSKISPNLGLWWYFFTEIFEFFLKFFVGVFNIYSVVYVLPLTVRFQKARFLDSENHNKYRIFPLVICYGFTVLTKPYPTLCDLTFVINILALLLFQHPPLAKFLRYPIVSVLLITHAIILSPIFYYLWIFSGSGNLNFFYAINLVYSLGLGSTLIDFIWSYLSLEYLYEKGTEPCRLTQI